MESNKRTYAVSLITDSVLGPASRHGLNKTRLALQNKGIPFEEVRALRASSANILIVAGVVDESRAVAQLLKSSGMQSPEGAESVLIGHTAWEGKKVLLVSGGDDRGLMYALLDVADRIGWAADRGNPLSEVKDAIEKPAVIERSLSIYTMNRLHFESFFYNEAYWNRYLDMLARNRFNTFALLFAYESSGYFAPPYPYFFDVDAFPDVYVKGLPQAHQQRNLSALNRLIEMTHARGLSFTLGIWDHIYRGGVQRGPEGEAEETLRWWVAGVTTENLMAYNQAALAKLLRLVPNLDAVQFRMHGESGLKKDEMDTFWANIYDVMATHGKGIRFDARAKGFPDHLIDIAKEKNVDIRICTKYWMEQMGLPFHPTHVHPQNQMDRRHSYADLLRYPQKYKIHWRLWNGGTARVLLWGDPDYVRRFAQSTHLYDGEGFDVNEPLGTKMAGHSHDMQPFELLSPEYRYYDWEFERYWHFFQLFGRLGYNPDTPPEVWEREFEMRFGKAAKSVERGLHLASQTLPRIVAYNYPYNRFPTTRGWAEKQRMEDLPKYAEALPSDTQQFLSINEAAQNLLEGKEDARIHPLKSSAWFAQIATDVLEAVGEAEKQVGEEKNKEFISTMVDLKILAYLALYHSRRIHAGLNWALFEEAQHVRALDDAIHHESQAIAAWEKIVESAGDVYHHNLMMGRPSADLAGHWKDELVALKEGLKELQRRRETYPSGEEARPIAVTAKSDNEPPEVTHTPITRAPAGEPLTIVAKVRDPSGVKWVRLRYRSVTQYQDFQTLPMVPTTEKDQYQTVVPGEHVDSKWDFMYLIEVMDNCGNGKIYPDLEVETPYVVVQLDRESE